jgi:tRNA A37 threonylcarbamoyladenosine dehydratase
MEESKATVPHWNSRTALLYGDDKISSLQDKHVLVIGLGGVGSFAAEFLVRGGIGALTIVDGDTVDTTNRNRQLPALISTNGEWKADVMAKRLLDINPDLKLTKPLLKKTSPMNCWKCSMIMLLIASIPLLQK